MSAPEVCAMLQQTKFCTLRFTRWILFLASAISLLLSMVSPVLAATATATSLSPASANLPNGQLAALVASVTSNGTAVTAGQVQFCDANAKMCFGAGLLAQAQLTSAGTARVVINPGPGVHSIKAVYNGTKTFAPSASTVSTITIAPLQPTISLPVSGSAGNYSFTANLSGLGYKPITGTVSLLNATNQAAPVIGTAAVGASTIVPSIQPNLAFATGTSPAYMASGDFNGDGYIDFAITNMYGNSITILLGGGGGAFSTKTISLAPNLSPEGLAVGDFNHDGVLDLALAENNNSAVQIFLGLGDGTFYTAPLVSANFGPDVLSVADFNRDGILDIAAVNQLNSTITILLGVGDGTFTTMSQTASAGYFTTDITQGDFNNDGIPDLAVANYFANTATVLLGNGDGTFKSSTLTTGVYPIAIATGDLNNDGKLDLVVANQFSQTLSIFLGNGAGGFTAQSTSPAIAANAQSVTLADFNQDGKLDIAVATGTSNAIQILYGNNNGTFGAPASVAEPAGASPHFVLAADINNDGVPDILSANDGLNQVQTFLNRATATAKATFTGINVIGPPNQAVAAAYSGDANYAAVESLGDIVNGTPLATSTSITAGATTVGVGEAVQITGILTPGSFGSIPANGAVSLLDGTTTIATGQYTAGVVVFNQQFSTTGNHTLSLVSAASPGFLGSKSGAVTVSVVATTTSTTTLTSSAASVPHGTIVTLTATVTSGGKPVTLGTVNFCKSAQAVCEDGALLRSVQLNASGTALLKLALPVGTNSIKAVFAGTGRVKGSSSAAQSIIVTGTYTPVITATASGTPGNYTITFAENMGSWQPLTAAFSQGEIPVNFIDASNQSLHLAQIYSFTDSFPFMLAKPIAAGTTPSASVSGDFNGDGKMDVAFASNTSGALTVELGNGNGTFTSVSSVPLTYINSLVAGDFNGDGKLDLAATDNAHNTVTVLLGNGDGTFTSSAKVITGLGPTAIATGDFNNDGVLDLAVVNNLASSVTILLGKGDGTFAADPVPPMGFNVPSGITTADFNGDGYVDLAVSNFGSASVTVLYSNGDGTFNPVSVTLPANVSPTALVALDYDRDGKPDLVVATPGSSRITVLLNQGGQTFTVGPGAYIPSQPINNMIAADFDGDGLTDLVFTDPGDGQVWIYFNSPQSVWNEHAFQLNANNVGFVAVADIDGDGGFDLIVSQPNTGDAAVLQQRLMFANSFSGLSVPGTGSHKILVNSPAASPYTSANSNAITLAALPVPADVVVQPSPGSTVTAGQAVTLTARVLPIDNFIPTGTISFFNGTMLVKTTTLTNNQAVYSTTVSAAGTYTFSATYNGDANLLAASSPATPIYVVPTNATSKTSLTLSAATAPRGTPVTLTAKVVNAANVAVTPGVINFCDATATVCANAALLGTAQLNSAGSASLKLALGVGTHKIAAVFPGSQTLLGSTSAASTLTVTGLAVTTTKLTSTGTAPNYSLTASVTGQAALPLSGTVTFPDATTSSTLGQASLGAATTTTAFKASLLAGLGNAPFAASSGDFNNDGKPDLAVLDSSSGVYIYLGNGAGGFTAKPVIATSGDFVTVVAGDFNSDGKLDLALGGFSGYVTIMLGNGDGTFQMSNVSTGGDNIYQLAVADINHDGKLDLVGAVLFGQTSPGLAVLVGNGDGTFSYNLVPTGQYTEPAGLAVGDFNGDGNPDVAVSDYYGSLLLFYGNGAGTFTLLPSNYLPVQGAIGIVSSDFNGDGKADLAVVNSFNATVTTLLGNGDGTFSTGTVTASVKAPMAVAVADFNLDGKADLVVNSTSIPSASILLGNGTGGFARQTVALPAYSMQNGVAVGDWNDDGRPDIYLPNYAGLNGSLFTNATTTSASATLTGVVVGGTVNQSVSATYSGSTFYATSTSASVSLVP
jgi:hypothetical protein